MGAVVKRVLYIGIGFTVVGLSSCANRLKPAEDLIVNTWRSDVPDFEFPEKKIPEIARRKNVGVAFSGGGTRSAAAVVGQLRALHEMGCLENIRYMSAVSGGTWGAMPYAYFDPDAISPKSKEKHFQISTVGELLGTYRRPDAIEVIDLPTNLKTRIPRERGPGSLTEAIATSMVTFQTLTAGAGDENFGKALNGIFLERFGLGDLQKFFTYDAKTRRQILARNSELCESDFYLSSIPGKRPPFFIANAYITSNRFEREASKRFIPVEVTPQYVAHRTKLVDHHNRNLGGGLVESFGYDSISKASLEGNLRRVQISQRNPLKFIFPENPRFSLSDVMAASGAAPMNAMMGAKWFSNFGFPEFDQWPVADSTEEGFEKMHNDGGAVDNLGVMPLLARGVDTIYAFCNFDKPYLASKHCKVLKAKREDEVVFQLESDIRTLFEYDESRETGKDWKKENQVFYNEPDPVTGLTPLDEIRNEFDRDIANGKPLVHRGVYKIKGNRMHSVPAGGEVTVVWFMLGGADSDHRNKLDNSRSINDDLDDTEWYQRLPEATQHYLAGKLNSFGHGRSLKQFPFYPTFRTNNGKMIDLTHLQAELLAHYSAYAVMESQHYFSGLIGK